MGNPKEMISARLDKETLSRLAFIAEQEKLGSRSDAVKAAIDMAYQKLAQKKKPLKETLTSSGFIGCASSGHSDTAENYKSILSESLANKWS